MFKLNLRRMFIGATLILCALVLGSGCKTQYEEWHGHIDQNGDCVKSEATECNGRTITWETDKHT